MTKAAFFSPIDDLYGANKMLVMSVGSVGEIVDAIDIYVPEDYGYLRRLLEQEGLCSTNLEEAMLPIVHSKMFSLRGLFKLVKQFIGALKKLNTWRSYDIVYINTLALVPMLVVIAFARLKVIVHVHEYVGLGIRGRILVLLSTLLSNKLILVSRHVETPYATLSRWRCAACDIEVIPNGIPAPIVVPEDQGIKARDLPISFLFVGRIMPEKGQWTCLEAIRILGTDENFVVHFFGAAPQNRQELAEEFVKFSDEIGVDQQIRFWGENSNPYSRNYYDFALVPSNMPDPFPTTVLEAMSIGLPVIATNNGGAKEAIIDNVTGLLIDPDSPSQLALAMKNADGSQ